MHDDRIENISKREELLKKMLLLSSMTIDVHTFFDIIKWRRVLTFITLDEA